LLVDDVELDVEEVPEREVHHRLERRVLGQETGGVGADECGETEGDERLGIGLTHSLGVENLRME
jgi:hypothetical protein